MSRLLCRGSRSAASGGAQGICYAADEGVGGNAYRDFSPLSCAARRAARTERAGLFRKWARGGHDGLTDRTCIAPILRLWVENIEGLWQDFGASVRKACPMLRSCMDFLCGNEPLAFESDFGLQESVGRLAAEVKPPLLDFRPLVSLKATDRWKSGGRTRVTLVRKAARAQ